MCYFIIVLLSCYFILVLYQVVFFVFVYPYAFHVLVCHSSFAKRKGTITACSLYSIFQTFTIILCWMNEDVTYGLHVVKRIPPLPKEKGKKRNL